MSDPVRQVFVPSVYYRDPHAALDWLEQAFGFERSLLIVGEDARMMHAEMTFDGARVCVGGEWADEVSSPASLAGKTTQNLSVELTDGIDAHCDRARAAGARIWREPEDQFYGARTYRAFDPEGHIWTFSQFVRHVTREEAEKALGVKIEGWA
jgi:uncharacterized glyoxalase superfamily protein PhnB